MADSEKATQSTDQMAIDMQNIHFRYDPSTEQDTLAISQWQLPKGQRVFLHGASGSGKSTLLNLISGTLKPNSGTIRLLEQPFSDLSSRKRDKFRARHIGVVFQQFNLIAYLSVADNIRAAAHFASNLNGETDTRIQALFEHLHLDKTLLPRRADELSVGQQQRVAIARALVNQPELLIVDEPTSALDTDARDSFMRLLLSSCDELDTTLLFVSHDKSLGNYFDAHLDIQQLNTVMEARA